MKDYKKEILNKTEKQQKIIDALFSYLKLGYKEEEYIQKSFIGESKIKTRIVVSDEVSQGNILPPVTPGVLGNITSKYKSNGRKTTHNKTK